MNTFRKSLLIGLTVIGMGAASVGVQAQEAAAQVTAQAAAQHSRPTPEQRAGKMAERMARHQAKLHDKLKITAAQEPAWNAFLAAGKAQQGQQGQRPQRGEFARLSAPERLEKWIAMSKQRIGMQESRLASLKTFYAVLTPEQQKTFNDSVPGGHRGGHGHRGWGGHGGDHGGQHGMDHGK